MALLRRDHDKVHVETLRLQKMRSERYVTFPVQVDDGAGEAADDVSRLVLSEETFPLQQLLQFTSVAQLHDQINHLEIRRALSFAPSRISVDTDSGNRWHRF